MAEIRIAESHWPPVFPCQAIVVGYSLKKLQNVYFGGKDILPRSSLNNGPGPTVSFDRRFGTPIKTLIAFAWALRAITQTSLLLSTTTGRPINLAGRSPHRRRKSC